MRSTFSTRNIVFFILILTLILITFLSKNSIIGMNILFGAMVVSVLSLYFMFVNLEKQYKNLLKLYIPISEIFENSPDAIYYKDKFLRYEGANKAFLNLHGVTIEELRGKTDADLYPENVEKVIKQNEVLALKHKKCMTDRKHIKFSSDEERFFETVRIPLHSGFGEINGIAGISKDITKRKNAEKELRDKTSQLTGILDNMPFVAYLKDLNGNVLCGNRKYKELLSCPPDTLLGKQAQNELLKEISNQFNDDEDNIIKKHTSISFDRKVNLNGRSMWLEIHKAPLFDLNKNIAGIVVTSKDITHQKELDAQKELFVATLTHDLKSPTSAQIHTLELLLQEKLGPLNKQQMEITREIKNSCSYVYNIINMLLSAYKFENGCVKLEASSFNLLELAEECNKELLCTAVDKNLYVNIKSNVRNPMIFADRFEIKRVIINLLSNAISYSRPNSTIDMQINFNERKVTFEVLNIGEYISPLELKRLFEKYFSKAEKFTKIGTGLGLYLSKQIITAHGGSMIAKSSESKINTFGFELDLDILSKLYDQSLSDNPPKLLQ